MKVQSRFDSKKIGELVCDGAMKFVQNFAVEINGERVAEYESLDAVAKDWEDYKPAEPYIKDKKVRKLVRDWAEINGIETVLVCQTFNAWGFKNKESGKAGDKEYMLADILFKGEKPEELEFGKEYTITELCGEEG